VRSGSRRREKDVPFLNRARVKTNQNNGGVKNREEGPIPTKEVSEGKKKLETDKTCALRQGTILKGFGRDKIVKGTSGNGGSGLQD